VWQCERAASFALDVREEMWEARPAAVRVEVWKEGAKGGYRRMSRLRTASS